MKRKVTKLNKKLIDLTKSATWNVWMQFGVDLMKYSGKPIDVTKYYMPQELQDEIMDILIKDGKIYKGYRKNTVRKAISWEILNHFPTAVEKNAEEPL